MTVHVHILWPAFTHVLMCRNRCRHTADTHTNNIHSTDTSHFHANCGCVLLIRAKLLIALWRSVFQAVFVLSRSHSSSSLLFSLTIMEGHSRNCTCTCTCMCTCLCHTHRHTDTEPSLLHSLALTPPCVDPNTPPYRVYRHHVHMCLSCCRYTRGRLAGTHGGVSESTYGFFQGFFSACRTTPQPTPQTPHAPPHTTSHNITHNITRRQRK